MRRRPAHVEELGQHGVATFGLQQTRLVARMSVALVAGHEARAHHDTPRRPRRAPRAPTPDRRSRPRPAAAATQPDAPRPSAAASRRRSAHGRRPRRPARSARRRPHLRPPEPHRAEATWTSTRAPPARARATSSGRSPNENDTHGTRSSTATSRRSSCSKSSTRFTQNGRSVVRVIERICSRRARRLGPRRAQRPEASRPRHLGGERAPRRPGRAAPA